MSASNVVAKTESHDVATQPATLLAVIGRAAQDPNTDVEKMERLLVMYERMESHRAEAAFNDAMTTAQSEIGRIAADIENKQTRSWYASYAAIDREVRPVYTAHGFALSFNTEPSESHDVVRVTCMVSHRDGFTRKYSVDMPADGKGAKGGDVMTKTHAAGSAMSYGQRYLLKLIFNIAIGVDPDDDDGNGASGDDYSDWKSAITECVTLDALKARKAEMVNVFKGATNVPKVLTRAYNEKLEALRAKA